MSVCLFFSTFTPSHQELVPNFVAISKIKEKTKTLPLPAPPPIQRGGAEWRAVKHFDEEGWCLKLGLKKGATQEKEVNEKKADLRVRLRTEQCMCLLTQQITLYRGHGLTLYTAHTIKWEGMGCLFQLHLV